MKCLTQTEVQEWLKPSGIVISEGRNFLPQEERKRHSVQGAMMGDINLWLRSEALIRWLPNRSRKLLYFKWWDTYPVGPMRFLEKIRLSCDEARPLFETPGFLFETSAYSDYENRTFDDEKEEAMLSGLILIVTSLQWDAILIAEGCSDFISISDGFAFFSSENAERLEVVPILRQ